MTALAKHYADTTCGLAKIRPSRGGAAKPGVLLARLATPYDGGLAPPFWRITILEIS